MYNNNAYRVWMKGTLEWVEIELEWDNYGKKCCYVDLRVGWNGF